METDLPEFEIRPAKRSEWDKIFMMGFDTWSGEDSEAEYLASCHASPKYIRGNWYVLEKDKELLTSLLLHQFGKKIYGLGSIATLPAMRSQGWASILISELIKRLEQQEKGTPTLFLYSDVSPEFYKRFGFESLPNEFQKSIPSLCMVRPELAIHSIRAKQIVVPTYF